MQRKKSKIIFKSGIPTIKLLEKSEFNAMHQRYLAAEGSEKIALRDRLLESQLPMIASIAQKYCKNNTEQLWDLVSAGYVKLSGALDTFDSNQDIKFHTFYYRNMNRCLYSEHLRIKHGLISGLKSEWHFRNLGYDFPMPIIEELPEEIEAGRTYSMPESLVNDKTPYEILEKKDLIEQLTVDLSENQKIIIEMWLNHAELNDIGAELGIVKKSVEGQLGRAFIKIKRRALLLGELNEEYRDKRTKYDCYDEYARRRRIEAENQ